MFTGLIQVVGNVAEVEPRPTGSRMIIDAAGFADDLTHGESIAVSGCCLTLAQVERTEGDVRRLHFDIIHQTLRVTTLRQLGPGSRVNLERAATPTTLLGGHVVQGHVDGVGTVTEVSTADGEHRVRVQPPLHLMRYIVDKGSITIDGVSLTVASFDDTSFEVALIPTTLELTTLGELTAGSEVNLEADALAKMVERLLASRD